MACSSADRACPTLAFPCAIGLIELHRVDLGQDLAFFDTVADVYIAIDDIAAGTRQYRRLRHCLDIPGQHKLAFRRRSDPPVSIHRRQGHRLFLRLFRERGLPIRLRQIPREESPREDQRRYDGENPQRCR